MKKVTSVFSLVLVLVFVICEFSPREITEPLYYSKEIREASRNHRLDPFIIAAVARTEPSIWQN